MRRSSHEDEVNRLKKRLQRKMNKQEPAEKEVAPASAQANVLSTGTVEALSHGTARVSGLQTAHIGAFISFFKGSVQSPVDALVMSMDEDEAMVALTEDAYGGRVKIGDDCAHLGLTPMGPVGDGVIGRVIDGFGRPADGKGPLSNVRMANPFSPKVPTIVQRAPVRRTLKTGIKHIDFFHPMAAGLRTGVFGPRQSGKGELLLNLVCNLNKSNDPEDKLYVVYVVTAKSDYYISKVTETLKNRGAMDYTTVVRASQKEAMPSQYLAPFVGSQAASHFRDTGRHCIIIYDDLAAHARAYDSLYGKGLGYAHITNVHAWLFEQSAQLNPSLGGGSTTCLAPLETMDDELEPQPQRHIDTLTSYLDNAMSLDPDLVAAKHWPPISCSQLLGRPPARFQPTLLRPIRNALNAMMRQSEVTANQYSWAKQFGLDPEEVDYAVISYRHKMQQLLGQKKGTYVDTAELLVALHLGSSGALRFWEEEDINTLNEGMLGHLKGEHPALMQGLAKVSWTEPLPEPLLEELNAVIGAFVKEHAPVYSEEEDDDRYY